MYCIVLILVWIHSLPREMIHLQDKNYLQAYAAPSTIAVETKLLV